MALDPNLILGSQPLPQVQGPLEQYQKLMQVRNLQAQGQQNALALQGQQMELAAKQQAQQQQQGVMAALRDSGGDVDKAIYALKAQGNPQALILEQHREAAKKEVLAAQETAQKISDSKRKRQLEDLDHIASLTEGIKDLPPELQGLAYQARRKLAIQSDFAKPEMLPEEWNDQTAQIVQGFGDQARSVKDRLSQQLDERKQAEAERSNVVGEQQKAADQAQKQQAAQLLEEYRNKELGLRAREAATSAGHLGLARERYNATLGQGVSETGQAIISPQAQMISDLKIPPPRPPASPAGMKAYSNLMGQVDQVRKQAGQQPYDATDWELKRKTVTDFAPGGKAGQQAAAINRFIGHTDEAYDAIKLLKQGRFTPGNAAYNYFSELMGSPRTVPFDTVRDFLVGEAAKTAVGGVPGEHELQRQIEKLKTSKNPDALKAALEGFLDVAGSQAQTLNETARKNRLAPDYNVILPSRQEILRKYGRDPETMKKAGDSAGGPAQVGGMYNGEKVLKVTRLK